MPSLLISYGVRIVYHIVLATTKAAVLTLYLRVFRNQKSKYIIWGTLTFVTLYTISLIFVSIFQCRPIRGAWDLTTKAACINFNLIMYLSAAVNVLVDIALVAIAIPNILPLKLPRTQKAALIGVASLSILVTISSIARVVRVFNLSSSKDFSWDTSDITTWSAIEINVGIFCAAAPAIRPLIRAVIGSFGSMNSTDNRRPSNRRYPYGNIDMTGRTRAIELSGGETFDATHTKSRLWSKVGAGANVSDGDSTKGVLNYKAANTGTRILHTVVVRIDVDSDEERARRDDEDENRNYV